MAGKNGGARPGAGRKPSVTNRPQLRDMPTQERIDNLVIKATEKADAGDSLMLKFMLEQIFGKAPQPLTVIPTVIPALSGSTASVARMSEATSGFWLARNSRLMAP